MKRLRTGVIGCGKVSHTHAGALSELPESEFVAAYSRSADKAEAFAAQYRAAGYSDLEAMLKQVDAVVVCTPHPFHAAPTVQALETGVHVLVEKPLASSLQDCDAMISTAAKSGCKLATVSQRRWYAPALRVKQAIDGGSIGSPVLGMVTMLGWRDEPYYRSDPWRGSWRMEGGGVLVNQAPHQLDLLLWFMGPIAELYGCWDNLNHPYIEVEDTAIAVLRFAGGGLGNIVVSNSQKPGLYGKVHVHGSNGASVGVQTDGGAMFIAGVSPVLEPPVNDLWTVPGQERMLEKWKQEDTEFFETIDAASYYHRLQIQDFLQAILEDREPLVSGEEGRKTVELFTGIYRSNRDGRPVRFPLEPEDDRQDFDGRFA
ncbi:MAG: Gfo/Idh/MocA family oxidoreductase [Spirochaetaceae bacterium]|nr:MAG: Gfo/Idh/MocA family oxidoreductase [Spirochaetaceae bacterium]